MLGEDFALRASAVVVNRMAIYKNVLIWLLIVEEQGSDDVTSIPFLTNKNHKRKNMCKKINSRRADHEAPEG